MAAEAAGSASAATSTRRPRAPRPSVGKILEASKVLFLEDGYDGVNLDRVATRAGVARQTVYNQFGSKEALFRATMHHHWQAFGLQDTEERLVPDPAQADPAGFLRRFAEGLLAFIADTDQVAFTRLVVAESRKLPWIAEEFYRLGKQPLVTALTAALLNMADAGRIDCPHPELAAHQFLGLVQEFVIWPQVMAIGPDVVKLPSVDLVVEEAVAMFLSRYAKPGAHGGEPA
ncbi:AcrR family transcriptional regulator [Streptomyces griseochromogenes]|uniref:AcrR family transcriptional regulator n=1 Tax=Streptomyces griseochromogenes TaxID=68214 RepID=A0A1B1AW80_9ACTN|nr:TetR/AcrR family transcriptional regulator [Streptomyces griseochromogenes]ANP50797.1 TetR family transcriptional regulator [Streptomyces griseochromogenes]MBP2051606.1 AcrR family transcriptional regulator [Streptomyces griseochromogenes]